MAVNQENVKIPSAVYKRLAMFAKIREVSVATLVNEAISEWLHRKEKHVKNPASTAE